MKNLSHGLASFGALLLLGGLGSDMAHAGGWTQAEGSYYAKAGYRLIPGGAGDTDLGFDATGEFVDTGDYADHAVQAYVEYGVDDHWTAILSATPLGFASYDDNSSLYGGPIRLGVRRAITTGALRTAAEVLIGGTPPLGAVDLASEADAIWQGAVPTLTASGALQLGYGFGKNWVTAELGYRWNSGLADAVMGGFQVGRQWERFVLDLHIPFSWALTELQAPVNYMGTGNTQYVGLGLGFAWWFNEHIGVMTGFESVVLARANAASVTLPIYFQFR